MRAPARQRTFEVLAAPLRSSSTNRERDLKSPSPVHMMGCGLNSLRAFAPALLKDLGDNECAKPTWHAASPKMRDACLGKSPARDVHPKVATPSSRTHANAPASTPSMLRTCAWRSTLPNAGWLELHSHPEQAEHGRWGLMRQASAEAVPLHARPSPTQAGAAS